jgi:S-adenosylmethionine hydrolase
VAAREITNRKWMVGANISSTFHGRDIFSPVGAHLAHGEDWTQVGPELAPASLVRLNIPMVAVDDRGLTGDVIGTDGPFGSLITNVSQADFAKLGYALGDKVSVTIDGKNYVFPFVKTFFDVALGAPLLYIDSRGRVGLALNEESFVKRYGVKIPSQLTIPRRSAAK